MVTSFSQFNPVRVKKTSASISVKVQTKSVYAKAALTSLELGYIFRWVNHWPHCCELLPGKEFLVDQALKVRPCP